jgi:hypothetical protein
MEFKQEKLEMSLLEEKGTTKDLDKRLQGYTEQMFLFL